MTGRTPGGGVGGGVAIATPHAAATAAAADAVRAGGSAVDAALAAAVTLTVVYPHNTGVGGDLIALLQTPDGAVRCVNASGPAAAGTDVGRLRALHGDRMPVTGVDTVTVPGVVAGWSRLHALGGRLGWDAAFTAAVRWADEGAAVSPSLAVAFAELASEAHLDPGVREVFLPDGRPPPPGARLRQPALAATLRELAVEGAPALYGGGVGERLVAALERLGSALRLSDLAGFAVEETAPLSRELLGATVWTAPPNSQGFSLLQTLGAVQHLPGGARGVLEQRPAALAALFHRADRDRDAVLADPRVARVDVEALLDPQRLAALAASLPAAPGPASPALAPAPDGDTVAVSVVDADGTCVCLIQSLFHSFGAAVCDPGTGVVLHNRGAFFSLDATSPNVVAPGKRPAHTLMPVLVTGGDGSRLAAGTMGGKGQPQILAQVLVRALTGDGLDAATSAPRWVVGGLEVGQAEQTVHVEAPVDRRAREQLAAAGWPLLDLPEHSEGAGHAQVARVGPDGGLSAATDPRSDGAAVVVAR